MERIVVEELNSDINAAKDKLKSIDEKVTTLNGRPPRQRISFNDVEEAPLREVRRDAFGLRDVKETRKEIEAPEGIRKRISMEDRIDRRIGGRGSFDNQKRPRPDYLDNEEDEEEFLKRQKRTLQSTVVMPALDSKGREEKIEKLNESENKDSKQRNRRLFSNLVMGTLSSFKKTQKKTAQQEKQEEVEKKLEETKKKDMESRREEKHELLNKRREQEKELQGLQRKKALIQYAEHHISQLEHMKGSIKTSGSPHIFWQPVKHTVRSLELKLETERQIDEQIKDRKDKLNRELEDGGKRFSDNHGDHKNGSAEDDEYEEEEDKNENEEIEVVLKTEDDLKREAEEDEEKEDDIDVHVELD